MFCHFRHSERRTVFEVWSGTFSLVRVQVWSLNWRMFEYSHHCAVKSYKAAVYVRTEHRVNRVSGEGRPSFKRLSFDAAIADLCWVCTQR